ncbi:hypothetical protein D3C75_1381870 [compost metagenome]
MCGERLRIVKFSRRIQLLLGLQILFHMLSKEFVVRGSLPVGALINVVVVCVSDYSIAAVGGAYVYV